MERNNERLNAEIERQISMWSDTIHGLQIKKAYENGCDYESICELCGLDYNDYREE